MISKQYIVEKYKKENLELRIFQDEDPESPREWDNLGKMVCFRSRYNLGDEHDFNNPKAFEEFIKEKKAVVLPLYLYDHGGLTISTQPFPCPWDSGQIGWIYCDYETIKKEYGCKYITKKIIEKVRECLKSEINTYDQYLIGDVFCFEIIEKVVCGECKHIHENNLNSCGGFYGMDWRNNGLLDNVGIESLGDWENVA